MLIQISFAFSKLTKHVFVIFLSNYVRCFPGSQQVFNIFQIANMLLLIKLVIKILKNQKCIFKIFLPYELKHFIH